MPFGKRRQNVFDHSVKYPNAKEVKISVLFTRLAEIDTINERFSCEATLFITWRETSSMLQKCDSNDDNMYHWDAKSFWDPQLYIDNAIGDVKEKDVKFRLERFFDSVKNEWYFEVHMIKRIQGTFFEKLELYHFPFDVQDLSITLTSHRTLDEINLVQDYKIPPKMTKTASLDKHIWKLYDHVNIKMHSIRSDLPPSSEYSTEEFETACSHPAITMQCRVSRKPGYFIINCLLPTLMITLCVFFTFLMDYSRFQYRFSLLFTTMLTSITFRWAIHGRVLPTISYMTFLDVYCVSSIMIVFSAMVWHAVYLVLHQQDEKLAERFDFLAMVTFAIVVVLIHIMQTIWFVIAFRKRLELENLDKRAALNYLNVRTKINNNLNISNDKTNKTSSFMVQNENFNKCDANSNSNGNNLSTNNLQSKRLYSFSKLDEGSIIAINIKNDQSNKVINIQNESNNLNTSDKLINKGLIKKSNNVCDENDYELSIRKQSSNDSDESSTTLSNLNNRSSNLLIRMNSSNSGLKVNTNNLNKSNLVSCYVDKKDENENYKYLTLVHQSSRDS